MTESSLLCQHCSVSEIYEKKKFGTVNSEWAGSALVKYLLHAGMRELGGFNLICYSIGTGVIQDH